MKSLLNDKGFAVWTLGGALVAVLAFRGMVGADVLLAWLGGGGGPMSGKLWGVSDAPGKK